MTTPLAARDAIAALQGHEAWAIIRRSTRAGDRDTVGLVGGRRTEVASILDVPLETEPGLLEGPPTSAVLGEIASAHPHPVPAGIGHQRLR